MVSSRPTDSSMDDQFHGAKAATDLSVLIFSSKHVSAIKNLYGDLNNSARVFQIKKDLADLHQGTLTFSEHLGNLTAKWSELQLYRPFTTDTDTILKRAEEDKIFELLTSLNSDYEDLRSHILMAFEFPSLAVVCNTIQREEVRKKVMNVDIAVHQETEKTESRAFASTSRPYRGKRPDLKCTHCGKIGRSGIGHVKKTCWILHPEKKM